MSKHKMLLIGASVLFLAGCMTMPGPSDSADSENATPAQQPSGTKSGDLLLADAQSLAAAGKSVEALKGYEKVGQNNAQASTVAAAMMGRVLIYTGNGEQRSLTKASAASNQLNALARTSASSVVNSIAVAAEKLVSDQYALSSQAEQISSLSSEVANKAAVIDKLKKLAIGR